MLEMLKEDVGKGDITSNAIIPTRTTVEGFIKIEQDGVAAGLEEAKWLLEKCGLRAKLIVKDGQGVNKGAHLLEVQGNARKLFAVERTVLNLIGRMSGIATETAKAVKLANEVNAKVKIAATRKTILRWFDKRAVVLGGGLSHRQGLYDAILIKTSHVKLIGSIEEALKRARNNAPGEKIEIEVKNAMEALEAAKCGAHAILLDNFSHREIRKALELLKRNGLRDKVLVELSGGINLRNIKEFARHDADIISMGCLTHSPKWMQVYMRLNAH